ncbi:MAG: hypothetical protein OWQ56_11100 [Acidithiobacillus caldus]|nr:hypothetical protein [Acidithiobacillus caldus]
MPGARKDYEIVFGPSKGILSVPQIQKKEGDGDGGQAKEMDGESLPPDALAALGEVVSGLNAVAASRATAPKGEGKYDTSERDVNREQIDGLTG